MLSKTELQSNLERGGNNNPKQLHYTQYIGYSMIRFATEEDLHYFSLFFWAVVVAGEYILPFGWQIYAVTLSKPIK